MAKFPSMPLMTDAYIADTQHLSNEEHGCYLRMLMIAWRTPECALPDDDKRIATMLGLTLKRWREKIKPVIAPFWTVDNGFWTQKKQLEIRENVEKNVKQKRDAYLQTERAKRLKSLETGGPADLSDDQSADESTKTKTKEDIGLGLEHRSLSPTESGPDPGKPEPEPDKFLIDENWALSPAAETRLKSRFVVELGADGFERQVKRFVVHHRSAGTVDSNDGFERSLENWLSLANANRDGHSPINGTAVSGAGPPLTDDPERFVNKAAWLYQEMISKRRPSGRQPSVLELSNLKILARQIAGGGNVEFGLKRIGFWTADELRSMVLDDDAPQASERKAVAG